MRTSPSPAACKAPNSPIGPTPGSSRDRPSGCGTGTDALSMGPEPSPTERAPTGRRRSGASPSLRSPERPEPTAATSACPHQDAEQLLERLARKRRRDQQSRAALEDELEWCTAWAG